MICTGVLASASMQADPYIDNVVALLHMDGADEGTTFIDETGKTWTPTLGAVLSTSDPKFGAAALNITTNDWLTHPNDAGFEFGGGDWTIEGWFKPTDDLNHTLLCYGSTYGSFYSWRLGLNGAQGVLQGACYPAGMGVIGSVTSLAHVVSFGEWHHIAWTRADTKMYLFLDGVRLSDGNITQDIPDQGHSMFLGSYAGGEAFNGRIDDFRITKGVARYTGLTCPVPTAPFPNP